MNDNQYCLRWFLICLTGQCSLSCLICALLEVAAVIFLADFSDVDAALDQYFSRSPPTPVGASLLAMVVNDDAGGLTRRGVLRVIASWLAPTEGAYIEIQAKKRPEPLGVSDMQRCG